MGLIFLTRLSHVARIITHPIELYNNLSISLMNRSSNDYSLIHLPDYVVDQEFSLFLRMSAVVLRELEVESPATKYALILKGIFGTWKISNSSGLFNVLLRICNMVRGLL